MNPIKNEKPNIEKSTVSKLWKNPIILTLNKKELKEYIQAAARSSCTGGVMR